VPLFVPGLGKAKLIELLSATACVHSNSKTTFSQFT